VETIAVYWEPIIRTYGFEVREGLTMARLALPPEGGDDLALLPAADDTARGGLIMAAAGPEPDSALALWVIVDGVVAEELRERARAGDGPAVTHPVEVVHFHGPHFGDRYGIASAALSALRQNEVTLLLAAFTGASVYLAVPDGDGSRAVQSLRRAFTDTSLRREEPQS
jgi:hypothetical protein